ncbi:MAG: acetyl-CoA decarbonylase/synthase complex subunit gamma [Thermodesulfobacteriota bacterium]
MALTGLQIHKLLPGTNCKDCGASTCLAFAMKLAQKKADLAECPHASEEARKVLGAAAEPPVRGVGLGPSRSLKLGEETVLLRHEKTFVHPTALAVTVRVSDPAEATARTLAAVRDYLLVRVGEELRLDMVLVDHDTGSSDDFIALARTAQEAGRPLALRSPDPAALTAAAEALAGQGCLLCSAAPETADALAAAAKTHGHALALTAPDLDGLVALSKRVRDTGFHDLFLHFAAHSPAEALQTATLARRAALKASFKPLGLPHLAFAPAGMAGAAAAVREICKYGGVLALPAFEPAQAATLLTLRQNIYTDPQKPVQVEPRVYEIGEPGPESPVFVTTNFSLTYFLVSGEIENAGLSAWLAAPDCDGMSVLTAWAAGKLTGAGVARFVKESGLDARLTAKRLILPGFAAPIRGELEDGLPGWTILVGPQEAADLEGFAKTRL